MIEKSNCKMVDFSYANLSGSVFWNVNLMNASFHSVDLTEVNFSGANLLNSDLTNTTITNRQLQSARSIRNAKLPNGTLGRDRNLIVNGDATCIMKSLHPWYVTYGSIAVVPSRVNPNDCQFVLQFNGIGAAMSQRINLVDVWDSTLWTNSNVELHMYSSNGVSIELNSLSSNGTFIRRQTFGIIQQKFH
jgi:uncharacterized protein YjbI with pentapeptide repeats